MGRAREPVALFGETLASPIGDVVIVTDADARVRAVEFADREERMRRLIDRQFRPGGWTITPALVPTRAGACLSAYFDGDLDALAAIDVAVFGTAFQRAVWAALRGVPPGRPVSYGALAGRLGRPAAVRATGHANAANPVSIVVPCHRLVGRDGGLTGYGGGIERKSWLLAHERRHAMPDS